MHIRMNFENFMKLYAIEKVRINPLRYFVVVDLEGTKVTLVPKVSTRHSHVYEIRVRPDELDNIIKFFEEKGFTVITGEAYPSPA